MEHIAALARLRLEPEEAARLADELSGILAHMEALDEVDVSGVEGIGGMADWPAPEREGEGAPDPLGLSPSELAPAWEEGFYVVPRLPALDAGAGEPGERAP